VQKSIQRCGAMTRKGTTCRNRAAADGYCWLHGEKDGAKPDVRDREKDEAQSRPDKSFQDEISYSEARIEKVDSIPELELDAGSIEMTEDVTVPEAAADNEDLDLSDFETTLKKAADQSEIDEPLVHDLELELDMESEDDSGDLDLGMEIESKPKTAMDEVPDDDEILGSADSGLEMESEEEPGEKENIDNQPRIELEMEDIELLEPDPDPEVESLDGESVPEAGDDPDLFDFSELENLFEEKSSGDDLNLETSDTPEQEELMLESEPVVEMEPGDVTEQEISSEKKSAISEELTLEIEHPPEPEKETSAPDLDQTIELDISDREMAFDEEAPHKTEEHEEVTEEDFSHEMENELATDAESIQDEAIMPSPAEIPETPGENPSFDAEEDGGIEESIMEEMAGYWLEIETVKAEPGVTPEMGGIEEKPMVVEEENRTFSKVGVPGRPNKKGPLSELSDTREMKPSWREKASHKTGLSTPVKKLASLFKIRISLPLPILLAILILVIAGIAGGAILLGDSRSGNPGNLKINAFATSSKIAINEASGPLFVITGQVKNSYGHDRMAVQVTGRLFVQGGFSKSATVYCGNKLSDEELSESNMAFILSRMQENKTEKVSSGGILPFVVVFSDLPDDLDQLERYTVEVVGSKAP